MFRDAGQNGVKCTIKVDVWALGCILCEASTGVKAFSNNMDVFNYIHSGKLEIFRATAEDPVMNTIYGLIPQMLELDPLKRVASGVIHAKFVKLSGLPEIEVQLHSEYAPNRDSARRAAHFEAIREESIVDLGSPPLSRLQQLLMIFRLPQRYRQLYPFSALKM